MTELSNKSLYESVEFALQLMDCDIGAAQCHGILCGMLCGVKEFDPSAWLGHTMGYHDTVSPADLGSGHALAQLLNETIAGFCADDFSLEVLLPQEDCALAVRTKALGSWCRGFLSGFGLTEFRASEKLSEDSRGFLQDLQEIGRIDPEEADDDGNEFALMELCEYTRMGTLLLREEIRFIADTDPDGGTIH